LAESSALAAASISGRIAMVSMIEWLWSASVNVTVAPCWPLGFLVAGPAVKASGALMSPALISSVV